MRLGQSNRVRVAAEHSGSPARRYYPNSMNTPKTPQQDTAAPGSVQPDCSATYRLLGSEDSICIGDEFLRDDCETWEMVSTANCTFVGERYDGSFLLPMRRRLPNEKAQPRGN